MSRTPTMSWAQVFRLRQHFRQSLWVVPLVGALVGSGLAALDLWGEDRVTFPVPWTYSTSTAGNLLSTVAGSMIGLIGLVVTIGVLVVQMATGTLSPRFMRLWYRDRLQKVVLASFAATFGFSFGLLRAVGPDSVPNLGVTLCGAAVTVDLILLLLYLDRFVHALRPVAVAAAMSESARAIVAEMAQAERDSRFVPDQRWQGGGPVLRVRADRPGAIQAMHVRGFMDLAVDRDLVCVFRRTVGDYVTAGTGLVDLHGAATERDVQRVLGMIALGHERTIDQDPAFAVRVIVDIAIRALSPAVNDPTTATQMINHLSAVLGEIGSRELRGRGVLADRNGHVRLAVPTRSWDDYLELGVAEIRTYGRTSPQTCRRLRALLTDLEESVLPSNRPAVQRQIAVLDQTVARSFHDRDARELAMTVDRQGIGGASHAPNLQEVPDPPQDDSEAAEPSSSRADDALGSSA